MTGADCRKRNVKVVLLAGGRDFGRCPIATHRPPALWPVLGEPALGRVLRHLSGQNTAEVFVCSDDDVSLLRRSVSLPCGILVRFVGEELPLGTAGCIRQAAGQDNQSVWVVMRAAMAQPPSIEPLLQAHDEGRADMTLMLKSEKERPASNELADIYIIEPRAIEHIPTEGFFDIKEGLIAALVHAGRTVRTAQLSRATGAFGERDEYLRAMSGYVRDQWNGQMNMCGRSVNRAGHPLISGSAVIDPSARLYGPVVIMSDVRVQAGAIVFGPTVMESGVTVGEDSLVENSVLWTGAAVGRRCEIRNCIVDRRVAVAAGSHIADAGITDKARNVEEHSGVVGGEAGILSRVTSHPTPRSEATGAPCSRIKRFAPAAGFNLLLGGLVWAYWPVLSGVWRVWRTSAEYSAGIIVPFLAVFIIWTRRKEFRRTAVGPSMWGLVGFAFSQAVMILGTFFMYDSVQRISFILAAASLVLLLFGRQVLRETSPVLLFACLMFPLPRCVHDSILMPAQKFSVISAEFCLQSMGVFATRAGNTLKVEESALAIGTGCDGLRMVTAFMVVAALAALLIRRSRWEKLLVFVSSVPIAMLCNTIRITLTAAGAKIFTQGAEWHGALHTAVGFAMIPLAAAGVIAELWLVSKLAPVSGKLPVNCKVSVIWEST